ncbi:OadG family transporter subunit [Butyrivibrio sp. AE2032]|uniref:OadG family transporter subunit n=1 Tax=Butyrivibrio sp. AE2032 TaxID=1458463 RepID=UPI0005538B15|nr:OadG family transporter subunit [Butyrivibrio sp. AE2032]
MNPVVQLAIERGQQLTMGEMLLNAGIVILVVFAVLLLMYILISISGKIIQAITKAGTKEEPAKAAPAAAAPATAVPAAAAAPEEIFSSGSLKLKNCDEKTAAMIMAIVADSTGIPLEELVFKSIKLVEKK